MDLVLVTYFMGSPVPIVRNIDAGVTSDLSLAAARSMFRSICAASSYEPLSATIVGSAGPLDHYSAAAGSWHSERSGASF